MWRSMQRWISDHGGGVKAVYGIKMYDADLWLERLTRDGMRLIPKGPRIMTWDTEEAAQAFVAANDLYMVSLAIVKI